VWPLELSSTEALAPVPGEIVIDVSACGVCRTDLQIVEGDLAARTLPIDPGYQAVCRVASVGDSVTDSSIGDRAGAP